VQSLLEDAHHAEAHGHTDVAEPVVYSRMLYLPRRSLSSPRNLLGSRLPRSNASFRNLLASPLRIKLVHECIHKLGPAEWIVLVHRHGRRRFVHLLSRPKNCSPKRNCRRCRLRVLTVNQFRILPKDRRGPSLPGALEKGSPVWC
jgi:hypothetical protein